MKHAGRITHKPSLLHYAILEKDPKARLVVATKERRKFLSTFWPEFSDRIISTEETAPGGLKFNTVIFDETALKERK